MCVLRASGSDFDVDAYLGASPLHPLRVHHRGDPRVGRRGGAIASAASGFATEVSSKEWNDLAAQVEDAIAFLVANRAELDRLRNTAGVENLELDFAIEVPANDGIGQSDRLPARLLHIAGTLGIDIVLSRYPDSADAAKGVQ